MSYIINIVLGIIYFIGGIILINKVLINKNSKVVNTWFLIPIATFYLLTIILSIAPYNGFNLQFVTPLSNISPFLFTLCFLVLFLPQSIKTKFYKMFCLFFVPMFVAGIFTSVSTIILQDNYHWFSIVDMLAHVTFSLFGYYLIKSKQVDLKFRDLFLSLINIYILLALVIILNLSFGTIFFGLNFYGRHCIYGFVITQYGWLSNLIYIVGLTLIMFAGYYIYKLLKSTNNGE